MSSFNPNDLVTDVDLLAYEPTILTAFGKLHWEAARQKALEDWLYPLLEARKFDPLRIRTRHLPIEAVATTSSVTTNKTTDAATANGLNLATILAASTYYLYFGFTTPFRGLSVRMLDNVN